MEAIAIGITKKRFLKSKADEIRSLKRRLENELTEVESTYHSDQEKEVFHIGNFENAKILLKETESFLSQNESEIVSICKDSDSSIIGDELRQERAAELFQYGFEVKYLPLARYLQTATKYISTENWCTAREEFRLARVFDRFLELRTAKATTFLQIPRQQYPSRPKVQHDALLEEVLWLSHDFRTETEWKIKIARQLAVEARDVVLRKLCVWTSTKAIPKVIPLSLSLEPFYRFSGSKEFLSIAPPSQKIDMKEELTEISIERDHLAQLCDLGDRIDNSVLGDLITTAEYQLGTSASFPNIIWYEHEDALLLEMAIRFKLNWILISMALNTQIYGGKTIRGPVGCQERYEELEKKSVSPKPQLTSSNPPLIHPNLLEKHNVKLGLMRGANTKIITPRSVVPKKISFNVHPSHEAAARKANQNISKLLTPSELAQRRLQRTRLVNESGTLNVPSIPRSTPSPNPSVNNGQNNVSAQSSSIQASSMLPTNSGSAPNLPPMPSAIPSGTLSNGGYNAMSAPMNSSAATAAQQIAAGMMRSGMIRPSQGPAPSNPQAQVQKSIPSTNPMMAQLQHLQQLQQLQPLHQSGPFGDSPSKSSVNFRPSASQISQQQQFRPPQAINSSINFMNLSSGINSHQMQHQKQIQSQSQSIQQQQQIYAKSVQSRPPASTPKLDLDQPDVADINAANLRTSPRKSSNK